MKMAKNGYVSALEGLKENGEFARTGEEIPEGYSEKWVVSLKNGMQGLRHKIASIEAEGPVVVKVERGEIPQAGSLSTPYAANYMKTEPGWYIYTVRPGHSSR